MSSNGNTSPETVNAFIKMQKELSKVDNLLYQYRPCRRDESTIYDIENIRHNVVYAQTPLNMNDPFDSRVGFSVNKIYDELINMVLDFVSLDPKIKPIVSLLLKHQLIGNLADFLTALNELKKLIISQRKAMHKENLSFSLFLSSFLKQLYNKAPKSIKTFFNRETFKVFSALVSSIESVEITEENIKAFIGFDEQLENIKQSIVEIQEKKYIPIISDFLSRLTISCFSSSGWKNPLMWSHYANSYGGFCVEYDFTNSKDFIGFIKKINYSKTRPNISLSDAGIDGLKNTVKDDGSTETDISRSEVNVEKLIEYLTVKDVCWGYEEEWRIINIEKEAYTPRFIDMPNIKSITLGVNIDYLCKQLIWDVCKEKNIPCYELVLGKESFSIDRKLLTETDIEFNLDKEFRYITLLCNSYVKNSKTMIEKAQSITKLLEEKAYDSSLLIEADKSVIDCLTDSYFIKSSLCRLLDKCPEVADFFITEDVKNGVYQLHINIEANKKMVEEQKKMLLSFASHRLISFQDYRLLCQLVFKIDSLLEKIDLLKWAEKLIAN